MGSTAAQHGNQPPSVAKVATASLIGTSIEWYDFYIYATAAGLVFGQLFFPNFDPLVATIVAFGSYAIGSLARPLGAVIFGHLGDRRGRKQALIITLLMMGIATTVIGLLPTYAAVGIVAPILLLALRFVQSLGVGGEWGGAVLMSVEHASRRRRVLYGSFPQNGSSVGLLLASGIFALVTLLPEEQFTSWGWRVPFLLSIVLIGVGLLIRLRITESPAFQRVAQSESKAKLPVVEVLRASWRTVLLTAGAAYITIGGFYIDSTFLFVYVPQETGMSNSAVLAASTITAAVAIAAISLGGWLGDRFSASSIFYLGLVITVLSSFPLFWLIETGSFLAMTLGMSAVMFGSGFSFATLSAMVAQWFPARVRYSGISLGYQLAGVVGGGLTPVIATSLYASFGRSYVPVALFLIVMSVISFVCVYAYRGRQHIDDEETHGSQNEVSGQAAS